jgi:hypothetical protein
VQVRGVAHPVQTAFSEMQKRRLEKIERGLSPESTSAVAGVVGAVVGLGAGWLLKGSLAAKAGGAEDDAEDAVPGSLGPVGMAPDGNHQFRGFAPQPRESRSGRKMNSIDLDGLKGGVAVITGGASGEPARKAV